MRKGLMKNYYSLKILMQKCQKSENMFHNLNESVSEDAS